MKSITVNGTPVSVTFERMEEERLTTEGFESISGICCVIFGSNLQPLGTGFSHCAPEDTWDKYEGYELTLARALSNAGILSSKLRMPFWKMFYSAAIDELASVSASIKDWGRVPKACYPPSIFSDVDPEDLIPF